MAAGSNPQFSRWITAIARDLQTNKGASIIIAGDQQPPAVHALAHAMNAALGNVGKTVFYTDPIEANPVDQVASLNELLADIDSGAVELLLIVGGNPVFNAPVEWNVGERIKRARLRMHLSLYEDETSEVCQWRLPESHPLECWGDGRAYDGTVTLQQPLIEPLYGGRAANEILAMFTDDPAARQHGYREGLLGRAAQRRRFRNLVAPSRCTMASSPIRRCLPSLSPPNRPCSPVPRALAPISK